MADVSESFNFYDLYGYFFPGVALTLLLVFPFWFYGRGPRADLGFGSALAATIAAYIVGHLLQTIAVSALPSAVFDQRKAMRRPPSEIFLDHDDATLTLELKEQVAGAILSLFHIDVNDREKMAVSRRDAFFLCRDVLVMSKRASYVEQFEGMYSMMRGLSAALLLGASYLAGWAWAFLRFGCSDAAKAAALVLGLVVAIGSAVAVRVKPMKPAQEHAAAKFILAGLMLASAAIGDFFGERMKVTGLQAIGFAFACLLAILLFLRCHGAYLFFAKEYAKAVWRGFLAVSKAVPESPKPN